MGATAEKSLYPMIVDNRLTVKNGEGKGSQYTDIPDYNITARYSS